MAGFSFRLQKVLDHRQRVEDIKKQEFIKARLDYLKQREMLEWLYNKLESERSKTVSKAKGIITYIAKYNYMNLLMERIEEQKEKVKLYEDEMMKKKEEFEKSQMDRKVIDKLKENAYNEYRIELDKLEQKQNDEFALYGHMRK